MNSARNRAPRFRAAVADAGRWEAKASLDPVARQLAQAVRARVEGPDGEALARIVALLWLERRRGHSRVAPGDWAGEPLPIEDSSVGGRAEVPRLPDLETWRRVVHTHATEGGALAAWLEPDAEGGVALIRDAAAERRLARRLASLLCAPAAAPPSSRGALLFSRLFEEHPPEGPALAAAAAWRGRLTLVTGGPGTGKTTTVVRILALLVQLEPSIRIALAAPTGKAAARLRASIEDQLGRLELKPQVRASLDLPVRTVHRLLGYRPVREDFVHHARRPLAYDLVVVDEASMLDLALADALVDALPSGARLVLLGDRDQLASVDAGAVLADLVDARSREVEGDARSGDFAAWAAPLLDPPPEVSVHADAVTDATVELRVNHRFREQPGISRLAAALRAGDDEEAVAILRDPERTDARWIESPVGAQPGAALAEWLEAEAACGVPPAPDSEEALALLDRVESGRRLLAALRRGPHGVEGLNAWVESELARRGWPVHERFYPGRPVLITRNAPESDLANGDLGVVVPVADEPGRRQLLLRGSADGRPRRLPVAQLPEHETAWAMTVHKSQGSEFEDVWLVLPPDRHPLLSRELLYTGITRARRRVTVVGSEAALRAAVRQVQSRRTRLAARLREALQERGPR